MLQIRAQPIYAESALENAAEVRGKLDLPAISLVGEAFGPIQGSSGQWARLVMPIGPLWRLQAPVYPLLPPLYHTYKLVADHPCYTLITPSIPPSSPPCGLQIKGNIAVIERGGEVTFYDKAQRAMEVCAHPASQCFASHAGERDG